jgi:hypothetical protein
MLRHQAQLGRHCVIASALFASFVGTIAFASAAFGANESPIPDLSGDSSTSWLSVAGDELMKPPSGPGPVTFDPKHPYISNRQARQEHTTPTYRVADLSNPILQPWTRVEMKKANEAVLAGRTPFRPRERCYPGGVPGFIVYTLREPIFFVQTPKEVLIINQGGPENRRIYLNVPHSKHVTPSWYGESVGHYEGGDTLVVDTIGLSTKTFVDNYRTPHTDKLHVVERFKLIKGGKQLEDLITVDDPGAFTEQWSAVQVLGRSKADGPLIEEICAENNPDIFDDGLAPLPRAIRSDF